MSAEAKNLAAIVKALEQHDRHCDEPALAILMNPHEVERLGWEDVRGVPVRGDGRLGTGAFEILCDGHGSRGPAREVEEEKPLDVVADDRLVTV